MKKARRNQHRRQHAGGKESAVADKNKQASPPESTGLTKQDVQQMIDDVLKPVKDGNAALLSKLEQLVAAAEKAEGDPLAAQAAGKKPDAGEAITLDQVEKLLEKKLSASRQDEAAKAARDGYIREKLKDLPARYQAGLGHDPSKWASEEQAIRAELAADLKARGVEQKNLGNAAADGGTTPERKPVDRSGANAIDLLKSGN